MTATLDWTLVDPDTGLVNLAEWRLRVAAGTGVGRCVCGKSLMPSPPDKVNERLTWLPIACMDGHTFVQIASRPVKVPAAASA